MLKKVKSGWRVVAKSGRSMGTYPTKKQAQERLQQVEMFKHMRQQGVKLRGVKK